MVASSAHLPIDATCEEPLIDLASLPLHQKAIVMGTSQAGAAIERLLELGLTPGTVIEVTRRGIFADPLLVRLRGFSLSLNRRDARAFKVRPLPNSARA